jgi:hypothetical protein
MTGFQRDTLPFGGVQGRNPSSTAEPLLQNKKSKAAIKSSPQRGAISKVRALAAAQSALPSIEQRRAFDAPPSPHPFREHAPGLIFHFTLPHYTTLKTRLFCRENRANFLPKPKQTAIMRFFLQASFFHEAKR